MNPEIKALWLDALRSGEYKQGKAYLKKEDRKGGHQYCCLGVLCDVVAKELPDQVKESIAPFGDGTSGGEYKYWNGEMSVLPQSVAEIVGMGSSDGYFHPPVEIFHIDEDEMDSDFISTLVDLNDTYQRSFEEIADVIEEKF